MRKLSLLVTGFLPTIVPEEQEVSIEFVVNSVVKAFEKNREQQITEGNKLAPFKINIEVCVPLSESSRF